MGSEIQNGGENRGRGEQGTVASYGGQNGLHLRCCRCCVSFCRSRRGEELNLISVFRLEVVVVAAGLQKCRQGLQEERIQTLPALFYSHSSRGNENMDTAACTKLHVKINHSAGDFTALYYLQKALGLLYFHAR